MLHIPLTVAIWTGPENREYSVGIRHVDHVPLSIRKTLQKNLADKWLSLGRYSSLADSGHGVQFFF
jgi:hypothetical protein